MSYMPFYPVQSLKIDSIYTVHYFEYTSSYTFAGEAHDFWEFLYVDKGSVRVTADKKEYDLGRGQMIFHHPGEFHALAANGVVAPNLVVVSFCCTSPAMEFFQGRITSLGAEERVLLGRIVNESHSIFSTALNDPTTHSMLRKDEVPFGSEQLLVAAIEELLIRLIRQGDAFPAIRQAPPRQTEARTQQIIEYLEQRLDQSLTIPQICRDNLIGRAQLERIFREQTGGGVIDYFSKLKIDAARRMIREGQLNITQISTQLGFSSVHYFSRRFKALTGMTPSEYARSVKMLSDTTLTT
jgi:AraC-like DNA-binding protein